MAVTNLVLDWTETTEPAEADATKQAEKCEEERY